MMKWSVSAPLALACLLAPVTATAVIPHAFEQCDGYGTPTENGDGMTKEARGLFGLFAPLGSAGNTRRTTPVLGAAGVAACDEALADPRLLDKQWMRKASLLRARAMHDLAAMQTDQALADLDRAETAIRTPDDPYIKRSLGLGIKLVRAFALRSRNDLQGAIRLMGEFWVERHFSRQVGMAMLVILGDESATVNGEPVLRALARLEPKALDMIYLSAFRHGDFPQVATLFSQLVAPLKTGDIGVPRAEASVRDAENGGRDLLFSADRGGRFAYALAAMGRAEAARSALADSTQYLAKHTPAQMPPPAPEVHEGSKARLARAMNDYLIRAGTQAAARLDLWRGIVELRLDLDHGPAPEMAAWLDKVKRAPDGAALDLLKTARTKMPGAEALAPAISTIEARLFAHAEPSGENVKTLFEAMPHTEIGQRIATYRKANSDFVGYFWGGVNGFKTLANAENGTITIQFVGEQSSAGVVEEMTLLRAADMAREAGKSGFVIRGRRDYQRTQNTTYYGAVIRSDPIGYSTELDVEFVDVANLPERYRSVPWRVLAVDDVITSLGAAYIAPPTGKPAS